MTGPVQGSTLDNRLGIGSVLRLEWRRIHTLRSTWVALAAVLGFAVVADILILVGGGDHVFGAEYLSSQVVQRDLVVRWLAAAFLGAQAFGHDFRYGTIRPLLLAIPRRGLLLAGKTTAVGLVACAGAVVVSALSLLLLYGLGSSSASALADPRLWVSLGVGCVSVGLVAALAAALSALLRSTGPPVVVIVVWAVGELFLVGLLGSGVATVLPFMSLLQATTHTANPDFGPSTVLTPFVFPLYLTAILSAARVAFNRRDAVTH